MVFCLRFLIDRVNVFQFLLWPDVYGHAGAEREATQKEAELTATVPPGTFLVYQQLCWSHAVKQ